MHARRAAGGAREGIDVDASNAVYLPRGMAGTCLEDLASSQAAVEELPSEAYRIVDVTGCDQKIRHLTRQYHVRIPLATRYWFSSRYGLPGLYSRSRSVNPALSASLASSTAFVCHLTAFFAAFCESARATERAL